MEIQHRRRPVSQSPGARWALLGGAALAVLAVIIAATIMALPLAAPPAAQPPTGSDSQPLGGPKPLYRFTTQDYHALVMAPGSPDTLFFGHHGGLLRSDDGGKMWTAVSGVRQDAMNLTVAPADPSLMYLAGHEVFLRSADAGRTWQPVQSDLPGLDLHWFAAHPDDPRRLYTNAVGQGAFVSKDGGATWTRWALAIPGDTPVTALAVLGGDTERLMAGTQDGLLLVSGDGGKTWQPSSQQRLDSMVMAFAANSDTEVLYAGTMGGLWRSNDGGRTWTRLPLETTVLALATSGKAPNRVFVLNNQGHLYRSDDSGATW